MQLAQGPPHLLVRVLPEIRHAQDVAHHEERRARVPAGAYLREVGGEARPALGGRLAPIAPLLEVLLPSAGCHEVAVAVMLEEGVEIGRLRDVGLLGGQVLVRVHGLDAFDLGQEIAEEGVGVVVCHAETMSASVGVVNP